MERRILLAKFENLLSAVNEIVDDEDLGQGARQKIEQIKNKVEDLVGNINKLRKKVKSKKAKAKKSDKAKPRK